MSYASEVAADSPRAWYRLSESSGLPQDSSGNANHASASTGTATYQVTGAITGEPANKSISLALDQWFSIPHHSSLNLSSVFTLEAWVKLTTLSGDTGIIMGKGDGSVGNGWMLLLDGGSGTALRLYAAGTYNGLGTAISDLNWHYVAVTNTGSAMELYLDGVDVGGAGAISITDSASALTIGTAGAFGWIGGLDELAIYSTALSPARIAAHYAAAPTAPTAGGFMMSVAGYEDDDE